ncbi:MAG: leucine-rich repeat domain-containing protein [Treponema sp.]
MKKSNSKGKALSAFKKLGAVVLMVATIFFVSFKQTGGGNSGTGGEGGKQGAPFVKGGAVLILSPNKLAIKVKAKTEDGSVITVEGCDETILASDVKTTLNATGTRVVLKGKIIELDCSENQLTELNVQGLTALQELDCSWNQLTEFNVQGCAFLRLLSCSGNQLTELNVQGLTALQELYCAGDQLTELNVQGLTALQKLSCFSNQLNAKAMTELLNALPVREADDKAEAGLYTEYTIVTEGNHKDFTNPPKLKDAFDGAKKRNWKLQKYNASGNWEDI